MTKEALDRAKLLDEGIRVIISIEEDDLRDLGMSRELSIETLNFLCDKRMAYQKELNEL